MCLLKDNRIILGIFLILTSLSSKGQMEYFNLSDQYMNNLVLINPAFCGQEEALCASLSSKKQWSGFIGEPKSTLLTLHAPIKSRNIGTGLQILKSSYGIHHSISIIGDYSYHIDFASSQLSFGLSFILSQNETRWDEVVAYESNDNSLYFNPVTSYNPNFRIGAYYKNKQFFTGFSVHNLISNQSGIYSNDQQANIKYAPFQFFYHAGYNYNINEDFQFFPALILRYNSVLKADAEFNVQLNYLSKMGAGLAYRTEGNVITSFSYQVNRQLNIGYSYGISTHKYVNQLGGGNELFLRYVFRYDLKIENPR